MRLATLEKALPLPSLRPNVLCIQRYAILIYLTNSYTKQRFISGLLKNHHLTLLLGVACELHLMSWQQTNYR